MTTTAHPVIPTIDLPCPSWCERPAGHGWESVDEDGHAFRVHVKEYSAGDGSYVAVEAEEYAPRQQCCAAPVCNHPIVVAGTPHMGEVEVSVDFSSELHPVAALRLSTAMRQAGEAANRCRTATFRSLS